MDELIDMYISSEVKYGRPYPYMIYNLMENDIQNPKSVIKFGDTKNDILEVKRSLSCVGWCFIWCR